MVSRANAQVGDPTPDNPFVCDGIFVSAGLPPPTWTNSNDPRNCPPPSSSLTPLAPGFSWISTMHVPDRRPAIHIQTWNGTWNDDARGLSPEWQGDIVDEKRLSANLKDLEHFPQGNGVPDQIEWLAGELERRYQDGWRRIIVRLPAGVAFGRVLAPASGNDPPLIGGQTQSMNQFKSMPSWKQTWMLATNGPIQQFRARHPANPNNPNDENNLSLEVYIGFNIGAGSCTTCVNRNSENAAGLETAVRNVWLGDRDEFGSAVEIPRIVTGCQQILSGAPSNVDLTAVDFSPRRQDHLNAVYDALIGWHTAGFRKIWLDTGADNFNLEGRRKRWAMLELAHNPFFRNTLGIQFGGEPLPYANDSATVVDDCTLRYAPFFTESDPVTNWNLQPGGPAATIRTFKGFTFAKHLSEVLLAFNPTRPGEPSFTFQETGEARRRGYILAPYNCLDRYCEFAKRWYSMGVINVPDFNGDGNVAPADRLELIAAIAAYDPMNLQQPTVFATGDINADGAVNQSDLEAYDARLNSFNSGNFNDAKRDYGIANGL